MDKLVLKGHEFDSRLLIGTGKYGSNDMLPKVIEASGSEIITMALRRVDLDERNKEENKRILHERWGGGNSEGDWVPKEMWTSK